jgi:hypothetical protein
VSPFAFPGVASFFIGGLLMSPIAFFGVASSFVGGLFDDSLCFSWGCLILHRRSFW